MAQVTLKGINKFYDAVHAVKDVNLQIRDKEFVVFVGPSGCGKTTTLRMIAGLEVISAGDISIDGQVVNDLAPMDRDIAMVFQNYALYPHMNVYDNMAFGLKMRKFETADIAKRVQEAAEILGIHELLKRKPRQLSGGQRQRVALGRAIVRDPRVFLFDEPLSNLDAKLRVQMRTEVSRIQQRLGTTTVYVTHDQTEALTLGDRVAVMRSGVLQQVGPPSELYNRPTNLFVAGFIGSPAMNFMPGELGDGRVKTPLGEFPLHEEARARAGSASGSVIVGIRPESFEDVSLVGDDARGRGVTFRAKIDLVESLGAEEYVYFEVQGTQVQSDELSELAADAGAHEVPSSGEGQVVARLDPETKIQRGEDTELWLDATKLHFFDPESGRNLAS
jgi:multiple sugar transport system ATP-binding protein